MSAPAPPRAGGATAPGFEPVREAFERLLERRPGWSGAVAARLRGAPVVDLWGGPDWREDDVVFLFSVTKGLAATCVALLVEDGLLDLDAPVAAYWPEFAANGKQGVRVRELLSHQAGLLSVEGGYALAELVEHEPLARRLAAQRPWWEPGTRHGYHALTIGPLVDELVRRVAGVRLGRFFAERVAAPAGAAGDVFIGFPEREEPRLVPLVPPYASHPREIADRIDALQGSNLEAWWAERPYARELGPAGVDLVGLAESAPLRRAGVASVSGIGNARGLARVYAACVSELDGTRLLSPATVAAVSQQQVAGIDEAWPEHSAFAVGYQVPWPGRIDMAGPGSFGHDGAGGCIGFAHPAHEIGFGFTTNHVQPPGGCDPAATELAAAVLACAGR